MLRSIAGNYARASGQVSWQRSYIDPIGEVWKPFLFGRLDGEATELNETGSITYASSIGSSTVANSSQAAFFSGSNQGAFARGMAGVGLEYRYPFTHDVVGDADDHADRAVHRPAERSHTEHPAQ